MVKIKPIAYGQLFHLLRVIKSIDGNALTFSAPYDYHATRRPEFSIDINRGEWNLIASDSPATYWQSKETLRPQSIHTSTNWLTFGIDELLRYPVGTLTRAIRQWKIQYNKNQAWCRNYAQGVPDDIQKTIDLSQTIHTQEQKALRLVKKIQQRKQTHTFSREQMEQQQQRIERLWQQTGDLLYANKKQLTRHDKFIGEESDHSPVISCLALPEHAGSPSLQLTNASLACVRRALLCA